MVRKSKIKMIEERKGKNFEEWISFLLNDFDIEYIHEEFGTEEFLPIVKKYEYDGYTYMSVEWLFSDGTIKDGSIFEYDERENKILYSEDDSFNDDNIYISESSIEFLFPDIEVEVYGD